MGPGLRKISAPLLLASLLLCFSPLPSQAGGGGPGCTGWPCGRTYWTDEQRGMVEQRGFGGFWWAAGEQEREIFSNIYGAGRWGMGVAFGPWMQRNFWTPLDQTPPDLGPSPLDNPVAIGMIGVGRWGKAMGRVFGKNPTFARTGNALKPGKIPGIFGGSAAREAEKSFRQVGPNEFKILNRGPVRSATYDFFRMAEHVKETNAIRLKTELPKVLVGESIGGNAGTGFGAVNAFVETDTGLLRFIGNIQEARDIPLAGTTHVTFHMRVDMTVDEAHGIMRDTTGFSDLYVEGYLSPDIKNHLESLARELFPTTHTAFRIPR